MTAILDITGLTRRFGGLVAVDAVDLCVAEGEVRGLIGPNGAGKTTLLNLIGGQVPPSFGQLQFAGQEIGTMGAHHRTALGIRRTFQNLKLFRDMTVLQNVMVGLHTRTRAEMLGAVLRTRGQRREEGWMAEEAQRALAVVGLSDYADVPAASLAYGHRRLLEIARAIVAQPRLLLLDEPAAGLNRTEAAGLVRLIRRISDTGVTIILVEHHMDVVMPACSSITVLNYGRRLAEGPPQAIRDDPAVIEAYLGRGDIAAQVLGHA